MKSRPALLAFVIGCLLGGLSVALASSFLGWYAPGYIDRSAAAAMALEDVRIHCSQARYSHPVDCVNFSLKSVSESKDGWTIEFESADHRRTETNWIGRRGEYDSMGTTNLDGNSANGLTENAPVQTPPSAKR